MVFLVKVFKDKVHADNFLKGELYAQRLRNFRSLEGDKERGDDFEGAYLFPPGSLLEMETTNSRTGEVEKVTVPPEHMGSLIRYQDRYLDNLNVFCTYAVDEENLQQVPCRDADKAQWRLGPPEVFLEFGKHAVAIHNPRSFVERVRKVAQCQSYAVFHGSVTYYEPEIGIPGMYPGIRTAFAKRKTYAHQKEFRIAIDTGTTGRKPITLNIGDISDIALYFNINNMDSELSITTHNP